MLRQFEKEGRRTISAVDQQGEQFLDQLAEDGVKGETLFQLEFRRQQFAIAIETCLLYTSPSPRDATLSRMPSSA